MKNSINSISVMLVKFCQNGVFSIKSIDNFDYVCYN